MEITPFSFKTPKKNNSNIPKIISANELSDLSIKFVNRYNESKHLAETLVYQKEISKGVIPVLNQCFGIGKTSLVEHFRNVLPSQGFLIEGTTHFDNLMKAAHVRINLSQISPSSSLHQNYYMLTKVFITTVHSALRKIKETFEKENRVDQNLELSIKLIDKELFKENVTEVIFALMIRWGNLGLYPLLVFFDDLTSIEQTYGSDSLFDFWSQLRPFCGDETKSSNVFVVVAGNSTTLAQLGKQMTSSLVYPTISKHIALEMLSLDFITEMIKTTLVSKDKSITMQDLLQDYCNIEDNFEYFCKAAYECSSGIPRLVLDIITYLTRSINNGKQYDLSNSERIDQLFHNIKKELNSIAAHH